MTKRWSETQHVAADWFRRHGWPFAEAVGNGRPGADITGMPGLAPEVKAIADTRRQGQHLRQANGRAGLAFVIYRPPGKGPATVKDWPVTMTLETFTALIRAAGYGSEEM